MRSRGSRNLLILGFGAIIIAAITTSIELWIYRSSGDIYLDRSRPGFLPDQIEAEETASEKIKYTFAESGVLTSPELEEYLKELQSVQQHIEKLSDPYSSDPLTDASLGITTAQNNDL